MDHDNEEVRASLLRDAEMLAAIIVEATRRSPYGEALRGFVLEFSPDRLGGIDLLIPAVYVRVERNGVTELLDLNEFTYAAYGDAEPTELERAVDALADMVDEDKDVELQRKFMETSARLLEQ